MTLPAIWRAGLVCIAAAALTGLGIAAADTAHAETATVEVIWLMPNGGTPDNVTYDQLELEDGIAGIPCGMWGQGDYYLREEAAIFTADHKLTEGEDHPTRTRMGVISWDFYYGGDCAAGVNADAVAAAATGELAATGAAFSPLWFAPGAFAIVSVGTALLLRSRRTSSN